MTARTTTFGLAVGLTIFAGPVWASTSTTAEDLDRWSRELKAELKAELKDELRAELGGGGGAAGAAGGWENLDLNWDEGQKPAPSFFALAGYFRFRYDLFKDLDLGTYYKNAEHEGGPFSRGFAPPVPLCRTDLRCLEERGSDPGSTLAGANLRLRLEPTLNVYEDIAVHLQIDILDNLVLGSTPESFPRADLIALTALSQTQIAPSDGVNALMDSIRIKQAYASARTPFGTLRVGRMGNHFGLGVLAHDGRGVDADFGETQDRVSFEIDIAGHKITPAFDWAVSGPTSALRANPQGQPIDRDQSDDVDQYVLTILHQDTEDAIRAQLENDQTVVNYGGYFVFRRQSFDAADYFDAGDPNGGPASSTVIERNANLFSGSLWLKIVRSKLTLALEAAGTFGSIENSAAKGNLTVAPTVDLLQVGGALETEYKLLDDALTLRLLVAVASGDRTAGLGVRPRSLAAPQPGDWDGAQDGDGAIDNFRFDADFRVDLIFWRQLVGLITDAIVFRPGAEYRFTNEIGARLDLVYSRAMFEESTPSAVANRSGLLLSSAESIVPDPNLGVEADLRVYYESTDGFIAWLEYGIFFPLDGVDTVRFNADGTANKLDASIAHTVQAMLALKF